VFLFPVGEVFDMNFNTDIEIVIQALSEFYIQSISGEGRVINQPPMSSLIADMELSSLVSDGGLSGERLAQFMDKYLSAVTRIYHPANIAHQQAVPHYMAALAGLIDQFVSSDGSIYEIGPASVSIEYFLINWLLEKVGWIPSPLRPDTSEDGLYGGGILTHGGSLSNLTAMIAARTKVSPNVWESGNTGRFALLAPADAHYSIARAAGIMGLGHNSIYPLMVDDKGIIIPYRLQDSYEQAEADGKKIIALVANAGTTAVGLYDPIREIGEFCRQRNIWFHVDGAHGGPAILSRKYRHLMDGIELADSFSLNTHKLMRVTAFCTVLLVRDARTIDEAFTQKASYLFHPKEQPGYDFLHRTIECTKPVLGLKFFMVLAAMGENGLGEYIDQQFDLTMDVYKYIKSLDDFDCPVKPQSNILCFRVAGADDEQLLLRDRLLARGNYYISTSVLNGKRYLRITLSNPATNLEVIKGLVNEIRGLI
jgi:L-2,4-diaminobutyrate decarboxylase